MIYDCFTFNNELELLELRLHELAGVVDKFVLVEATRTFTNLPKRLHFLENLALFEKFRGKIIHVMVEDSPDASNPWILESFQRNCIARGLTGCQSDDWVLISDVDEIPRAETVARVAGEFAFARGPWANYVVRPFVRALEAWSFSRKRAQRNNPFIFRFQQTLHRHFINCVTVAPPKMAHWYGTRMFFYRDFSSAEVIRHSGYKVIKDGGWHFTSMGGAGRIVEKIKSFSHQEFNKPGFLDANRINEAINIGKSLFEPDEELKFMPLDKSYPCYVLENPQRFKDWIKSI